MLKRVSIQNFKSLKDVTLDLQKVNLLIGPNNSGKTNFLKALEFCDTLNEEQSELNQKDIYKKDVHNDLSIYLIFDNLIEFISEAYFHIKISPEHSPFQRKHSGKDYSIIINSIDSNEKDFTLNKNKVESTKGLHIEVADMKYFLGLLKIYKPDPNSINKTDSVGEGANTVSADASNLVSFLDYILSEHRSTFNQIEQDLQKCVPEFTEINLQNVKSTDELVKQFGDKTFKRLGLTDGRQNVKYWADELSEGTLYFLALLCIVNQPNPPKLLLLEEPEKGIHPRRIREVMDFIFRLAEEKDVQIILTTHNEHVLDDFATRPEAVFVFDKDEEGATYVRNLQHDIIEPTNQRNRELGLDEIDLTTNLSENWLYGLLGGVPTIS